MHAQSWDSYRQMPLALQGHHEELLRSLENEKRVLAAAAAAVVVVVRIWMVAQTADIAVAAADHCK